MSYVCFRGYRPLVSYLTATNSDHRWVYQHPVAGVVGGLLIASHLLTFVWPTVRTGATIELVVVAQSPTF